MKVILTYFRIDKFGKYYSTGSYETSKKELYEIWDEVYGFVLYGTLPDLVKGATGYMVLVDVPDHPYNHPHIVASHLDLKLLVE